MSALTALLTAGEWQPIESAPKDGRQILTYRGKRTFAAGSAENWYQTSFWSKQHQCLVGWPKYIKPTHWMPLPEPPK